MLNIGPILTGGIKKGTQWFWETVTSSVDDDVTPATVRSVSTVQVDYTHWFPGRSTFGFKL